MKKLTTISLSLLAAALFGTAADAQQVIRITGSSAFRPAATAAIIDYLANNGANTVYSGYYAASSAYEPGILNAGVAIFANGTITSADTVGTATVIIETSFTGSLSGVVDLALGNKTAGYWDAGTPDGSGELTTAQIDYINNNGVTTSINGGATSYGGGANLNGLSTTKPSASLAAVADEAFSDASNTACGKVLATASLHLTGGVGITSANGTQYNTIKSIVTQVQGAAIADAGTGNDAALKTVGIVPFEWVVGNITSSAQTTYGAVIPTNITQQIAKALMTSGYVAQSVFTGTANTADTNNLFLLCGRSEDSGTRINGLADAQFGLAGSPIQFILGGSNTLYGSFTENTGGYGTANGSLSTEPAIYWSANGHGGTVSGATLSNTMLYPEDGSVANHVVTGNNSELDLGIAYLGTSDAYFSLNPAGSLGITGSSHLLKYNGVDFTIPNVQNGEYSYWNYEHCYVLAADAGQNGTVRQTALNSIADLVFTSVADISAIDGKHAQANGSTSTPAGILLDSNFHVQRTVEGGIITHL